MTVPEAWAIGDCGQAQPQVIGAVLFDLDGTLVDSSEAHYLAYRSAFEQLGGWLEPEIYDSVFGLRADEAIPAMAAVTGLNASVDAVHSRKAVAFRSIVRRRGVSLLPLASLLEPLGRCVPLGLVTSASRRTVSVLLEALSWSSQFAVVVTGEDVNHPKPAPDCYALAVQRLNADPRECLAFEDSPAGVNAAIEAGIRVVQIGSAGGSGP